MHHCHIEITERQIDPSAWEDWLEAHEQDGATVTFVGKVRQDEKTFIKSLFLEHYPVMTETVLEKIAQKAIVRFQLTRVVLIHRVGQINLNERIVFVGVSAPHRTAAFEGTQFIMDLLKNEAPFWKKEQTLTHEHWVEPKKTDELQLKKWHL